MTLAHNKKNKRTSVGMDAEVKGDPPSLWKC